MRSAIRNPADLLARLQLSEHLLPGAVAAAPSELGLAGGIVAEATMDLLGLDRLEICPWALREGIILRHLDRMS